MTAQLGVDERRASDRAAFFLDGTIAAFDAAARAAGGASDETFALAGRIVRMRMVGRPLTHLLHAFRHLTVETDRPADLTLHLWDSAASGTKPLSAPFQASDYGLHGLIDGFNDDRFYTAFHADPRSLSMFDGARRLAVYWTPDAAALPVWERGAPMRPLIGEWLRREGLLPVHGGAVGVGDRGVFLAGAGGSGKSNTALACLAAGLSYASDDFCMLSRDEDAPSWRVHSLYGTGKLSAGDFDRLPVYRGLVSNPHEVGAEKALLYPVDLFADRLSAGFALAAILLPRVRPGAPTCLKPASLGEAQRSVAVSTMNMSPGTAIETFRRVAQLVRELPAWELHIGDDWHRVPQVIADFLKAAQAS